MGPVRRSQARSHLQTRQPGPAHTHVVVDARYQDSRGPTDSFVEGGGGFSLRYLFNESRYEGYRGSVELLIQYKAGNFFNRPHGASDGSFHGLVLTGVLRF